MEGEDRGDIGYRPDSGPVADFADIVAVVVVVLDVAAVVDVDVDRIGNVHRGGFADGIAAKPDTGSRMALADNEVRAMAVMEMLAKPQSPKTSSDSEGPWERSAETRYWILVAVYWIAEGM